MAKLKINNLYVEVEGKLIIKGLNLEINEGEIHAIMGPNGAGKSTLSQVIMGHPRYKIIDGDILLDGQSINNLEVDKRAKLGMFLSTQYPAEIPGITNSDFLRSATSNLLNDDESLIKFIRRLEGNVDLLNMPKEMVNRSLNEGFSGGEKKKNEILQLKMLKPKIAILDEIDSGLDVDALNIVGKNLYEEMETRKDELSMLLITHYKRLLDLIKPTHVHIMVDGKIVNSGDYSLVKYIEDNGYDKYIVDKESEDEPKNKIGSCATSLGVNHGK